ncbi:hypothetical protein H072_2080 [Dactylellina haptotyla CBS 200.50]|uniref:F-box domain-containing protein n=1 Tax=Dactylellina haptotyla (strain CBS 200.50) TaxID=1284197 RepID=S8ALT7_DACHA|nr:hypothetical protein H072_2080 [Dactylellina haptotyla CBS 200.50]
MASVNSQTLMEKLPFDVMAMILPDLDLFDIARCRLVSRGFYRLFTDESICRFALKKSFNLAPESFNPSAGNVEMTRLIARTSRWIRKDPSRVEKLVVAKGSADPSCLGWGVVGNTLVYQSPSHIDGEQESRSKLILHCLASSRREINIDLVSIDPLFDSVHPDEENKWRIWIPKSADRGDKFLTGQKNTPKFMMVASHPRTTVQLQSNPRGVSQRIMDFLNRRSPNLPTTIHQALVVVSLDPNTLGQVVCHWTIDDEIRSFDANAHYFAYSKKGSKHKYNVAFFNKIIPTWPKVHGPAGMDQVASALSTFAFLANKEISSLGADIAGRHLFVSFATSAQVVDVKTGSSLKKTDLSMPPLRDAAASDSVKTRFTFFQATETTDSEGKHVTIDLCCHLLFDEIFNDLVQHRQATALWKLDAKILDDGTVDNLTWRPAFMATPKVARQHIPVSMNSTTLASNRLHDCLAISTVRVNAEQMRTGYRGSHAYHQQRGLTLVGSIPSIVTNLYNVSIFENDANVSTEGAKNAKWLHPTSSIHVLSPSDAKPSESSSRSKGMRANVTRIEAKVPLPTIDCAPIAVGCGWVVFAKDRSDQCSPLNLYGRIGNLKKADELIIVRFD